MLAPLEMLAMVALLATAPGSSGVAPGSATLPTVCRAAVGAVRTEPTIPWAERYREEIGRPRTAHRFTRRLAVGLGAALAWDAADLPRHRSPGPLPRGEFEPGALFTASLVAGPEWADRPDGAIGSMIERWNALYPPYALEGMRDR
jgi:hypothetical protein